MATLSLASCARQAEEEIPYTPPEAERYSNHIEIDGQWGASAATGADGQYGIGDPFVMRWNGKYYLYPSTSDPCDGIKVFESEDLVHWTDKGYAVAQSEPTVHGAYAPEVVYYNGYFYLCQSRAGKGHYIYRSESPTEGFKLVSSSVDGEGDINFGNLGMGIDGSFYVSDEGKLYLLHTSTPTGLKYNEIEDIENICPDTVGSTKSLGNSSLDGWIEGPGIFRRGNFSYLTYTGNHVLSEGYRVGYSYAENLTDLSAFILPQDNITIIDTDAAHHGLGHSSNVTGPDLDSVYTAYHSLVGRGPARRYNLDRYFACGSVLTADGVTHRPVAVPASPAAGGYADSLKNEDMGYVFGTTEDFFTAECNFVPQEGQALFFGASERGAYLIRLREGKLSLLKREGGKETVLGEKTLSYPAERLAVVRIENGDGVGHVYFNGMRVLTYEAEGAAGKLGYACREGVGYTAFSNDVFGTSDFEAFKNFPTKFPATSYLKGERRGYSIRGAKRVKGGVRVGEKESTVRIGDAFAVSLSKGDWVKYAVDVPSDGRYSVSAELSKASAGATVRVSIGDERFTATVPALGSDTVRVHLGEIFAKGGVSAMKVEVLSGKAQFVLFDVNETESGQMDLSVYEGTAKENGGALTVSGEHGALIWKNTACVDFEATVEFSCAADIGSNFGFMIRASHYSYFSSQTAQSWRGYYLQLAPGILSLRRYDYGDTGALAMARTGDVDLTNGARHTVVIRTEGHAITVLLDGTVSLTATDSCAFFGGRLGVYADVGELTVHSAEFRNTLR